MNGIDLLPLASFTIITTFTPGPNNIMCASMGILYGFKRSLPFMLGITIGFCLFMILCGGFSGVLIRTVPELEPWLRWLGAGYILWLAWSTVRASYALGENSSASSFGFMKGFLLQFLNPKAFVFGLTIYTVFLAGKADSPIFLALTAPVFAVNTFIAISAWAISGAAISRYLHQRRVRIGVNLVLALGLVYVAVDLLGVFQ